MTRDRAGPDGSPMVVKGLVLVAVVFSMTVGVVLSLVLYLAAVWRLRRQTRLPGARVVQRRDR